MDKKIAVRYRHLDIAKGISLIFIMMAHSCGFPFGLGSVCTAYFVAIFFIISGYLQTDKYSMEEFVIRRFHKIIYPYFVYNFIILIIYAFWHKFESVKELALAIGGIIYSNYCLYYPIQREDNLFFYRIENNPTWFLTAFFCANILFVFYLKFCRKSIYKVLVLLLCVVLTQLLSYFPLFLPWNADKAFIGAAFMILGYELKKMDILDCSFSIRGLMVMGLVSALVYGGLIMINPGVSMATREYGRYKIMGAALYLFIGLSGTVVCIVISKFLEYIWGVGTILAAIGKEGLAVMSLHLIFFRIFDDTILKGNQGFGFIQSYWVIAAVRIGFTVGIIMILLYGRRYVRRRRQSKVGMG